MTRPPETSRRKPKDPSGMRMRPRSDGTLRVWWEPRDDARRLGFTPVDLDEDRMGWSRARAEALNAEVEEALRTGVKSEKKTATAGDRTIDALIADYKTSPHFLAKLAPKTRDSYRKLLLQIADKWGTDRAASFDKATMAKWYKALFATRGQRMAQSLIRMMSILFGHAEELGWRRENSNPCYKLKVVTPKPRARAGSQDELSAILAGAEALGLAGMALAIRLALYQGQRQTDIRSATRAAFAIGALPGGRGKGWIWQFIRSKRKNIGAMVIHPEVVPHLRRALANTGTPVTPLTGTSPLIIDEATGAAYSEFLFNKRWRAILAWAAAPEGGNCPGISTLQFRDLRRTFGVLARAAGASKDDIADVLGNSAAINPILGETYMPASFETASRAVSTLTPIKGRKKKAGPA